MRSEYYANEFGFTFGTPRHARTIAVAVPKIDKTSFFAYVAVVAMSLTSVVVLCNFLKG